jgi:hypothetical protein
VLPRVYGAILRNSVATKLKVREAPIESSLEGLPRLGLWMIECDHYTTLHSSIEWLTVLWRMLSPIRNQKMLKSLSTYLEEKSAMI